MVREGFRSLRSRYPSNTESNERTSANGEGRSVGLRPRAAGYVRGRAPDKKVRCEAPESRTRREKPANAGFEAVREGFEPPVRCRTPVFEAGSFNHSDISPGKRDCKYSNFSLHGPEFHFIRNDLYICTLFATKIINHMEKMQVYEAPETEAVELKLETSILAVSDPNASGEDFSWD